MEVALMKENQPENTKQANSSFDEEEWSKLKTKYNKTEKQENIIQEGTNDEQTKESDQYEDGQGQDIQNVKEQPQGAMNEEFYKTTRDLSQMKPLNKENINQLEQFNSLFKQMKQQLTQDQSKDRRVFKDTLHHWLNMFESKVKGEDIQQQPEQSLQDQVDSIDEERDNEEEDVKQYLQDMSKSQLLSLYEKFAVCEQMTSFEQKVLKRLDPKVLQKIRNNLKYKGITDISQVIQIDSTVLNYGEFYPGKILGSTLQVWNTSPVEQILEIAVDNSEKDIPNSENLFQCWFIENPISKDLAKSITLRLSPNCEQEFIIVLKSPQTRERTELVSGINLSLLSMQAVEEKRKKGYLEKKLPAESRMKVMINGIVDPPKITCTKALKVKDSFQVLPIAVKKQDAPQKFRFPFKNLGNSEVDVDFQFVSGEQDADFFCMPSNMKIGVSQTAILNVVVKTKPGLTAKRCIRMLVAKIKDSSTLLFSYIVEAQVVVDQ